MGTPAKRDHCEVEKSDSPGNVQVSKKIADCEYMSQEMNGAESDAILESNNQDSKSTSSVQCKLDQLIATVNTINTKLSKLDQIEEDLHSINGKIKSVQNDVSDKQREINTLKAKVIELTKYKDRVISLEAHSRRDNLLIDGLNSTSSDKETNQKCIERVYDFFVCDLRITDARERIKIVRAHRCGPPKAVKTMIVKFHYFPDREEVWGKRFSLRGRGIWLSEDFPPEINHERDILKPYFNKALTEGLKPKMTLNKLIVAGKAYTVEQIGELPKKLDITSTFSSDNEDNTVYFFGAKHPLSNFHPAPFSQDGVKYVNAEQYYQHRKAEVSNDYKNAEKIMATSIPFLHQKLGSEVKTTDNWIKLRPTTMATALRMKFDQNEHLKKFLLSTGDKYLAEANVTDLFWGIGVHMKDLPKDRDQWPGQNVLGELLMELREAYE